jgi:hypothetical protein
VDTITVLSCSKSLILAKTHCADGTTRAYDQPKTFNANELPVAGLSDLHRILGKLISNRRMCVVRGALIDGPEARGIRRLKNPDRRTGELPTLRAQARRWVALDIDGHMRSAGIPAEDLVRCAREVIGLLPMPFPLVDCIVQATAGHGTEKYRDLSRLRLWFWLDRAVTDQELKAWFAGYPVDHSLFDAVQVCYTAAPIFEAGVADPVPQRLALVPSERGFDTVEIPDEIPEVLRSVKALAPCAMNGGTDSTNVLDAVCATIDPAARHRSMLEATRTVAPYIVRGELDRDECIGRIGGAMADAGREPEPDEIERALDGAIAHARTQIWDGSEFAKHFAKANPEPEDPDAWRNILMRSDPSKKHPDGQVLSNIQNADRALCFSPEYKGRLCWNDFRSTPELLEKGVWRNFTDHDPVDFALWLIGYGVTLTPAAVYPVMKARAFKNRVHPVRDYLNSLKWDGTPRIDTWLIDHAGAADTRLNRAFGRMFLIGMIARVMAPGCKHDNILILEGPQGLKKSTLFKALAVHESWFSDDVKNFHDKDSKISMQVSGSSSWPSSTPCHAQKPRRRSNSCHAAMTHTAIPMASTK